jgi:hypothetical protein
VKPGITVALDVRAILRAARVLGQQVEQRLSHGRWSPAW